MTARTILTLANGRGIDLLNPRAEDISFEVIAEHLAKENRYNGATRGIVYSVAQHSVHCAEAALETTKDETLAAYLLCHDMHEAFFGDDTTPKKKALGSIVESFGALAQHIDEAFGVLTDRMDAVIHEAAGLPWPVSPERQAQIHHIDRALLATEWRDLMQCPQPFVFEVPPLAFTTIKPWPWGMAKVEFMQCCVNLLPAMQARRREALRRVSPAATEHNRFPQVRMT